MDVLQDRLLRARAAGALFAHNVADRPWGLRLPADTQLAVHAIAHGRGWLWLDDPRQAVQMQAGDIAMVRGPHIHHLAHAPGARCMALNDFLNERAGSGQGQPHHASSSQDAFLCGAYRLTGDVGDSLLTLLPDVLHLRPQPTDPLGMAVQMLTAELTGQLPGQHLVLDRLLDVVLVHALRHHLDQPGAAPPWYKATAHPGLSRALQALHEHPDQPWTVPQLAKLAGTSRATFARTFHSILHQTPGSYLTDWRMTLARDALRDSDDKLTTIARRCGYSTAYAFSTAFSRHHGQAPGHWRDLHRTTAEPSSGTRPQQLPANPGQGQLSVTATT